MINYIAWFSNIEQFCISMRNSTWSWRIIISIYSWTFFFFFLPVLGLHCICVYMSAQAFSSCSAPGLLCCGAQGSHCSGFSCCGSKGSRLVGTRCQQFWHTGSRAWAYWLWCPGLAAPQHVGSAWTRDWTHVPCIGRWTSIHCTTKEVPILLDFIF